MLPNHSGRLTTLAPHERSFQVVLWTIWTLIVAGFAFFKWYTHVPAEQSIDLLGLIVYAVLAEIGGLVVLTLVELWMEPYRFLD